MLDIKALRKDREQVEKLIKTKDPAADIESVLRLDTQLRELKTEVERLKAERNAASKVIGERKRQGEETESIVQEMARLADAIHTLDSQISGIEKEFELALARLPNLPMEEIKVSQDPKDNVCIKEWGERPTFAFPFKNHVELNEKLHLFDFVRGAKIAGSGWPIYRGWGARLEWALIQYMIGIHLKNGFEQWIPPLLVKREVMFGSGQLPKFDNQQFKINDEDYHLYLIPTAEVPLNSLHADEILHEEQLPLRYVAYTPCFRREAGAAGSQERGLIRMHQFNKVEMFAFTTPDQSPKIFDEMVASAEEILQGLGLHYRNMLLVTGDMSFASAKTIDVEVWLPGQNRYYEVSSISNCTDYQSRRSAIRYRHSQSDKPEFVHTLNGSGLATSRLMVALIENNQREDGSVVVPQVLRPYLNNLELLTPNV